MSKILNKIIKVLIACDFFINLGWGLIAPIFAIFIVQNITVGSVSQAAQVAGFSSLFFWITKSLLQIPIGNHLDNHPGEKDDFLFMVVGMTMTGLVPLGYIFSTEPWHIYTLQILYGVSAGMTLPAFAAIFTRHINKNREAITWSTYSTFLGLAAGTAGGVGGIAVSFFGFKPVLFFISILTFFSAALLILIKDDILPAGKKIKRIPLEKK